MKRLSLKSGARSAALATGLLVAGFCAGSTEIGWARTGIPFDSQLAEKTLTQGFSAIAERTLDKVGVPDIATEGLKGLAAVDPALAVDVDADSVRLSETDRIIAEYPRPDDEDVRGWARLAVTIVLDASAVSPAVKGADLERVLEAVFDATLSRLDVFSRYHGAREARRLRSERNGFGGIGITFDQETRGARIKSVLEDSPAARGGIKTGDLVLAINGATIGGLERDAVTELLRGPVGTDMELIVAGWDGRSIKHSLRRMLIVPPTVTASTHAGVLTLHVSSFNQRTAESLGKEVRRARDAQGLGLKGIVLDLRGNPGGLLDQAVMAADLFIPSGTIVQTRGRHPLSNQSYDAAAGDPGEGVPLAVLVDGRSASAAEILAGALEDSGRAVIIGTNTYGKGTVQTVLHLPNDGEITLTWSRFYTPSGYALHGLGVLPTICTALVDAKSPESLPDILGRATTLTRDLAEWRQTRIEDVETRASLRDLCPASPRADIESDQALAEKLVTQPSLYQRALAMTAPPAVSIARHTADRGPEIP